MNSLDCKIKKYILIFSLFLCASVTFALSKTAKLKVYANSFDSFPAKQGLWDSLVILYSENSSFFAQNNKNFDFSKKNDWVAPDEFLSDEELLQKAENEKRLAGNVFNLLFRKTAQKTENSFNFIPLIYVFYPEYENLFETFAWYLPSDDSGKWIDSLLISLEEERIADEILMMDNKDQRFLYENSDLAETEGGDEAEKIEEKYFYQDGNTLSHFEYGDEIFMMNKLPENSDGEVLSSVHKDSISLRRYFYDSEFKILKKEIWELSGKILNQRETYKYDFDSKNPSQKIIEEFTQSTQNDGVKTELSSKTEIFYAPDSLVEAENKYQMISFNQTKNSKDSEVQKKLALNSQTKWRYDEQRRVIQSVQNVYSYNAVNGNQSDVFTKKYNYRYNSDPEIPADTRYYEDDVLKMALTYKTSKADYVQQYFFDDNFSIISYYEKNILVRELYLSGNTVIRARNFNQEDSES